MKIALKVIPNARKNECLGWEDHPQTGKVLKLRIAAPPVEGKANKAIIAFLAQLFSLRKSDIELLHGETGRLKIVELPDGTPTTPIDAIHNN